MKRWFDVLGSTLLLLLSLPVLVVVLVGCALSLRANPFFWQERIGRGGRAFHLLKVRTLPTVVPPYTGKYDLEQFRIPRFCQAVRDLHLDELPQLVQVLLGRMSLVGPRPEMRIHHDGFDPEFALLRTSVRPGCTGLWQVSEKSGGLISESPEFDEFYVEHHSVRLDLWIAFRTVRQMLPLVRSRQVTVDDLADWAPASVTLALD